MLVFSLPFLASHVAQSFGLRVPGSLNPYLAAEGREAIRIYNPTPGPAEGATFSVLGNFGGRKKKAALGFLFHLGGAAAPPDSPAKVSNLDSRF